MTEPNDLRAASDPAERRVRLATGHAAGVTEPLVREMVYAFYDRVRADDLLGPVFDHAIGDDWDTHLPRMCDFWSSVLLMTGRFKGSPMSAHARIAGIEAAHFERWLALFRETAGQVCPPAAATLFVTKAEMIAESLQLGIAFSRGGIPAGARRRNHGQPA